MKRAKYLLIIVSVLLLIASSAFGYDALMMPKFKWFDASTGDAASGWKVYTYSNLTSTNKATYKGPLSGAAENTNPVILNSRGEADIWLDGNYTIILKNAEDDVTPGWTLNNIQGSPNQPVLSIIVATTTALESTTSTTDGEMAIVAASPALFYTWDDDNSKWRVRSGNQYATSSLPSSTTYTIETGTTVFDTTINQLKYYNGTSWLPATGNIIRQQVFN